MSVKIRTNRWEKVRLSRAQRAELNRIARAEVLGAPVEFFDHSGNRRVRRRLQSAQPTFVHDWAWKSVTDARAIAVHKLGAGTSTPTIVGTRERSHQALYSSL